jgi:hypothetical protein
MTTNKKVTREKCANCEESIDEKDVEKKIGDKTLKFCSEACAVAYKETRRTYEEEVGERVGSKTKGNWSQPVA